MKSKKHKHHWKSLPCMFTGMWLEDCVCGLVRQTEMEPDGRTTVTITEPDAEDE